MLASRTFTASFRSLRCFSGTSAASAKVGFIGLGNMGGHMVNNLLAKGHEVVVYDVSESAIDLAVKNGAERASGPADLASRSSTIVTMLPSSPHVEEVYCGESGILSTVQEGTLLIDSSTIDPNVSRKVAEASAEKQARMVDAPVSGGVGGAEAGTLTFMVGGSEQDFESSKAVLGAMGANIVHCGGVGTGEVAKLCNNMVLGVSMAAVAEAMVLGEKLGMEPKKLAGILNTSTARCWSSDTYNPYPGVMEGVPSSRGYTGGFGSALMLKDLGLAQEASRSVNGATPMGAQAQQLYQLVTTHGAGHKDFSAILEFYKGEHMK